MIVSYFNNRYDELPVMVEVTWEELQQDLSIHVVRQSKDGQLWSPASYRPGTTRAKENVETVSALVLEFDDGIRPNFFGRYWRPFEVVLYSTFSHTSQHWKWRAVFPLTEPVPANLWPRMYAVLSASFGHGHSDRVCKDCSRMYYTPACPARHAADRFFKVNKGKHLDVSSIDLPPEIVIPSVLPSASVAHLPRYIQKALEDERRNVAITLKGGRNNQLNRSAFALGTIVGTGALERATVEQELEAACHENNYIRDKGIEATRRTIKSGLDDGISKPRRMRPQPCRLYSSRAAAQ